VTDSRETFVTVLFDVWGFVSLCYEPLVRRLLALSISVLAACSHGGAPTGDLPPAVDLAMPAGDNDLASAADLARAPDLAEDCVRSLSCDARTAEHGCGVTTASGQRYPDQGRPYCANAVKRETCSCDLVRCSTPKPLCAGTYRATFNERLISGCNGVPGQLDGTCWALWNVIEGEAGSKRLLDETLLNVQMAFNAAEYTYTFTIDTPTKIRAIVQQSCWFADVSGVGNSGRSEVSSVSITQ